MYLLNLGIPYHSTKGLHGMEPEDIFPSILELVKQVPFDGRAMHLTCKIGQSQLVVLYDPDLREVDSYGWIMKN